MELTMRDTPLVPHAERDGNYYYDPPTPVPIFQHQYEWERLLAIYMDRAPARVLEIGTYHGGTLYHLLRLARPGTTIVSVDSYTAGVDNRPMYADWTTADVSLHAIAGNSRAPRTVERVRAMGPYDFIWIDAGHYEAEVDDDWRNYGAMAAPGAIVAFHDIITHASWPSIEVEKVWRRIQRQGYLTQEFTWSTGIPPNDQGWGGIGVVYMP
jgi:predicted O-methyltransferase YrrM